MKKLLFVAALALTGLAVPTGTANAGRTFGLFVGCHCCNHCCGGMICLRQYNAFSPVACGSMVFQGCVTVPPGGPGFGYGGDCADGSCGAGCAISQLPGTVPGTFVSTPAMEYAYSAAMQGQQIPVNSMPAPIAIPTSARMP
jgi:hypothetical protein